MRGIRCVEICVAITFLFPTSVLAAPAQSGKAFIPPVDGEITKPFKLLKNSFGPGSHRGIDFGVPSETPVKASGAGEVTFVGPVGGEGPFITISHEKGLETTYSFLSSTDVVKGQKVAQGDVIGKSGEGHPGEGAPALHFGAKKDDKYIHPQLLFMDFSDITELIRMVQLEDQSSGSTRLKAPGSSGGAGSGSGEGGAGGGGHKAPSVFGPKAPAVIGPAGSPPGVAPVGFKRSRPEVPTVLEDSAELVKTSPPNNGTEAPTTEDPLVTADWWSRLTQEQRDTFIELNPQGIGKLEGVAPADRNRANREALSREIASIKRQLAAARAEKDRYVAKHGPPGRGVSPELRQIHRKINGLLKRKRAADHLWKQLKNIDDVPGDSIDPEDVLLLDYDTSFANGEGRAIVALGDPSKADYIGVVVPGITNRLDNFNKTLDKAANLRQTVKDRFGPDLADQTSTIAWLGYDTPESIPDAWDTGEAIAGARSLKQFVNNMRRLRDKGTNGEGQKPYLLSVFAHSYGAPTSAAAAYRGMLADNLAFAGGAGGYAKTAKELDGAIRVWAGRAWDDGIIAAALTGRLGGNPTSDSFGANIIPMCCKKQGHGDYFNMRTRSVRNMAGILVGRYDSVE